MTENTTRAQRPAKPMKMPARKNPARPTWGIYIPDIKKSYPNLPVRGRIVKGHHGLEFRPDPGQLDPRNHPGQALHDWITGESYDLVVQKAREEADLAIKDLQAGIDRLRRFIDNN